MLVNDAAPDIFVVTESWISSKIPDSDVTLNGYNLFRVDRKAKGGSVAIFIRNHLVTHVLTASSVPKCFDCLVLDVCVGGNAHFVVSGVYRPPSAPKSALDELGKVLSNFISSDFGLPHRDIYQSKTSMFRT